MKARLKTLLIISILVFLYAIYYWVVPLVVNIQSRVGLIQNYVQKEFGLHLDIQNPNIKMGLIPAIWLDSSYFGVIDKDKSPLSIVNPKIKIRLIPLLFGEVKVAYFSCDKIYADMKVDKNSRFYIGNYMFIKPAKSKISIEDVRMDVNSYEISFNDELNNKKIHIIGDYFDLQKFNVNKHIKFSSNSKVNINGNTSVINADVGFKIPLEKSFESNEIVFDGTVTNLNLADISPYIKKISKGEILESRGLVNIEADTKSSIPSFKLISMQVVAKNLYFLTKSFSSINFKDKVTFDIVSNVSKNALRLKKFQMLSKNINVNISGKINKITSKNPLLDLVAEVKNSRSEDFVSILPAVHDKNTDINFIALKKYGFYSDLSGKISIKGKSDAPEIKGTFTALNGYVVKPLNIPKATVKLKFTGKSMFMDILVPTSVGERVSIKGSVNMYGDKASNLDITSTPNVDLQTTKLILNPVHEIFNFEIGPVPIMDLYGQGNINLKVKGTKQNPHLKGAFNFKNTTASFNDINMQLKNGEGSLYFNDKDTHFITRKAFLENKPIVVDGHCSLSGDLDFKVKTDNQQLSLLINIVKTSPMLKDIQSMIPPIDKPQGNANFDLNLKGKVKNINAFKLGTTVLASGNIKLLGNDIMINGINFPAKNIFGNIKFNNQDVDFDLYSLVDKSKFAIKGKIKKGVLHLKMKLDDVSFMYYNVPVKIFSGNLEINNNRLVLYKVNALLDSMPVLLDGVVDDIFTTPKFNVYINSKPSQKFIEKYINKQITYPLKIKGDIIYSSRIQGTKDLFNAKTEIQLEKDSNIYYMGSTLGDANDPIRIYLNTNIAKNSITINNFQYDKLISSQNGKEFILPQLNAQGQIVVNKNDIVFHNFRVKTQNPTDAKIFNILFKKSMIKQGVFASNVIINNSITSPHMLGFLNFTGIDIPLLATTIKDISLNFDDGTIDLKTKGEIFGNDVILFANVKNQFRPPYELKDVDIYFGNLDINEFGKNLSKLEIETDMNKLKESKSAFNIQDLVIKNAKLKADSVFVKNIFAKNFTADFSLDEKMLFSLDNFKFEAVQGKVNGNFKHNLLNSKSSLELHVDGMNANQTAEALFDLPNQIFGSVTGKVELTCNSKTHKTCMNTLTGNGGFRVANGRMPKLGSLEYLLKSANLVKSGVTGVTINSIIDLITPLKTGEFENINGSFNIDSGVANSIQIFSKGKDLSLFLTGNYNFQTLVADMEVFGRLSKKISTVLGPIGNASLNSLFNTIPGVNLDETNKTDFVKNLNKIPGFEFNDKKYRIFSAEIYGDINGENYVQSFKWIE